MASRAYSIPNLLTYGRIVAGPDDKSAPVIARVDGKSLAARAGLRPGDAISKFNGRSLGGLPGAQQLIAEALYTSQPLELLTTTGDKRSLPAIDPPPRSRPVHPAQIYSSITAGLLAWVLWSFYPVRTRDGQVAALMITLYPIARFFEEMIRVDEPSVFGTGLSISQNVSILLLIGAVGLWIWLRKHPAPLAFPAEA